MFWVFNIDLHLSRLQRAWPTLSRETTSTETWELPISSSIKLWCAKLLTLASLVSLKTTSTQPGKVWRNVQCHMLCIQMSSAEVIKKLGETDEMGAVSFISWGGNYLVSARCQSSTWATKIEKSAWLTQWVFNRMCDHCNTSHQCHYYQLMLE